MSKPYRIRVKDLISAKDHATYQIEPLPLLSNQDFANIFTQILLESGWELDAQQRPVFQSESGEIYTFDPKLLQIQTSLQSEASIDHSIDGWDRAELQQQAEQHLDQRRQLLQEQLAAQLSEQRDQRRQWLESLLTQATARALKIVAQELGQIQSIEEHRSEDGSYKLSISIKDIE
jgi:hypothetical protein